MDDGSARAALRGTGVTLGVLLTALLWAGVAPRAQAPEGGGAALLSVTPKEGENGERVRRRAEWFFGPRRAGADRPLSDLRSEGLAFTRERARLLQAEGALRAPGAVNAWSSRGPASSNFGGWDFGKVSGRIPALAKDWANGVLYVGGASGGLWKSTDDGASWTSIFDSAGTQTVGAIAVDTLNPSTLWVGTGENTAFWCEEYFGLGLLRSGDGGATWEPRNGSGGNTLGLSVFCAVLPDPRDSNRLVVGGMTSGCTSGSYSQGGVFTTTDAGLTWTQRLTGYVTSVVRDPGAPDTLWAGLYYGGVYKSTNNGVSWTQQTASSLPAALCKGRVEVAVAPSSSDTVYALFAFVDNSGTLNDRSELWQTTTGGASWTRRSTGANACDGQCGYNMTLRVHPTLPGTVYRGTIQLFKSTNNGSTWTNLTGEWGSAQKVHQDTHLLLMNPTNGSEFYVGCDGGVWKTTNGGTSFTNLNANLNLTQFYAVGIHPTSDEIIVGGAQDNSSLARVSSDTWELQEVTGDGFIAHIDPVAPDVCYITSYPYNNYPSVYRSDNGVLGPFNTYVSGSGNGIGSTSRIEWVTPYDHAPDASGTLFLGTYRMYRTKNKGANWTAVGPTDMTGGGSATVYTVNVSRTDGRYVYAGTSDSRIWQSVDSGDNWTEVSAGLPARVINDIAADPADGAAAFCVVSGFNTAHLYELSGTSWTARGTGLPNVPANTVLALSDTELFVGTDVGIFRSTDRGQNFAPFMEGLPQGLVVTDLKYNGNTRTLTAGTYGRGAWQYTFAPPAEAGNLLWDAGSRTGLSWSGSLGATGFRVYRGAGADLATLPTGAPVCRAYQGTAAATGALLTAEPPSGSFFWYLAAAYNALGEGSVGSGTATGRLLNSSGSCPAP